MHDLHSAEDIHQEEHDVAQHWFHQDGNAINSIEQKLNSIDGAEIPLRTTVVRQKPKRKDESPLALCCSWIVEHQIGLSLNLLTLLSLAHLSFPKARHYTRKFVELSYYNPDSQEYTLGWDDACIVLFWIVLFTGLRASVMDYVLLPLAQRAGIMKKKDLTRFAEQGWLLIYCTGAWSFGMYVMYHSDYWLNIKAVWRKWPNREICGLLKWYILVQYAFWLQQIIVINIEKRRKDFWQMFTHHIITSALLFTSYGYHFTKVANIILCLMDAVDIFLPLAKCLKYLRYTTLCDVFFGLFLITWIITRHVLYLMVCYSVWYDVPNEISYGCYLGKNGNLTGPFPPADNFLHLVDPFRNSEGVICLTQQIKWSFLTLLLFLEVIIILWFVMICRVAFRVLAGDSADDNRSDDEDDEFEETEPMVFEKVDRVSLMPLEEEVGVDAVNLKGRTKRYKKVTSSASGVTLPGHSDRKELLGRIGCERGV